jgi:hypothetical protein
MDALLGLRSWHWRATDWPAAAVAGFAAGAVLMVLDLIWSAIFDPQGPWRISHMVAPILTGSPAPAGAGYAFDVGVVAIALVTHYVLGVVFGVVMAFLMAQLRLDTSPDRAVAAGAVLGLLLYLLNFEVLAAGLFPWLAALRGWGTIAAHGLFGIVAALLYWKFNRVPVEP